MRYEVLLIRAAQDDYNSLDGTIKKQVKAQLRKLTVNPELGRSLGKKMGLDLTGYCSLHFYGNKYRIVYKIDAGKKQVVVVGIGLREKAEIYEAATRRLERAQVSAVCRLRCCHEPKERVECDAIRFSDQVAVDIGPGGHVVAIEVLDASELIPGIKEAGVSLGNLSVASKS